jgi:hypothetical protein
MPLKSPGFPFNPAPRGWCDLTAHLRAVSKAGSMRRAVRAARSAGVSAHRTTRSSRRLRASRVCW